MEYWETGLGRIIVFRCDRGEDLLKTIERVASENNIANSTIVSAIGTLEKCRIHRVTSKGLPPEEEYVEIDGVSFDREFDEETKLRLLKAVSKGRR